MTLVRWLKLLPNDIFNQDPALVILVAWTHLVHSREAELVSSLDRAEARLQKQNVAVDYIENILAAFREDVHGALPDASNHSHFPDSSIYQSSNALLIPTSLRGVGPHGPYGPEAAFPIPPSKTPHHPVIPSPSPWSNP